MHWFRSSTRKVCNEKYKSFILKLQILLSHMCTLYWGNPFVQVYNGYITVSALLLLYCYLSNVPYFLLCASEFFSTIRIENCTALKQKPRAIRWQTCCPTCTANKPSVCTVYLCVCCVCECVRSAKVTRENDFRVCAKRYFGNSVADSEICNVLTNALTAAMQKLPSSASFAHFWPFLATTIAATVAAGPFQADAQNVEYQIGAASKLWINCQRLVKLFKLCTNCNRVGSAGGKGTGQRWNARHAPCAKAFNLYAR